LPYLAILGILKWGRAPLLFDSLDGVSGLLAVSANDIFMLEDVLTEELLFFDGYCIRIFWGGF
jgi:hypothetical protein